MTRGQSASINDIRTAIRELSVRAQLARKEGRKAGRRGTRATRAGLPRRTRQASLDVQPTKNAAVEHDRRNVRVDLNIADPQDHDRVVSGRNELLDRAFQPDAGALDKNRTTAVGHRLQTGESITGLGGQAARGFVVRLAQNADTQRAHPF